MALNDLQVAQDAEDKAKVDVETTSEHVRLLGNDPDKPAHLVDIVAPVSGVITDQQVTNAAGVQAFNMPAPFTISDLSYVWVVCDVMPHMTYLRSESIFGLSFVIMIFDDSSVNGLSSMPSARPQRSYSTR